MNDDDNDGPRVAGGSNKRNVAVDPRYAAALRAQKEQRAKLTARRRPILRLVWDRDSEQVAAV